jgi:putative sigma-54 modulation protein
MDVTDALRNHVHARVESDLTDPRVESVHVILDVQRANHLAEVVLQGKQHIRLEADATTDDMYRSIDQAVEKMARQLKKIHDKVIDNHKQRESMGEVSRRAGTN